MGSTYHLFQPVVITFSIELPKYTVPPFMMLQAISEYLVQAFIKDVMETQRQYVICLRSHSKCQTRTLLSSIIHVGGGVGGGRVK